MNILKSLANNTEAAKCVRGIFHHNQFISVERKRGRRRLSMRANKRKSKERKNWENFHIFFSSAVGFCSGDADTNCCANCGNKIYLFIPRRCRAPENGSDASEGTLRSAAKAFRKEHMTNSSGRREEPTEKKAESVSLPIGWLTAHTAIS